MGAYTHTRSHTHTYSHLHPHLHPHTRTPEYAHARTNTQTHTNSLSAKCSKTKSACGDVTGRKPGRSPQFRHTDACGGGSERIEKLRRRALALLRCPVALCSALGARRRFLTQKSRGLCVPIPRASYDRPKRIDAERSQCLARTREMTMTTRRKRSQE